MKESFEGDVKDELTSDRPFFSVLIPVYNVENYITKCLDSIDAQTFTDYEVVLVDDGSPDGCLAILDAWCAERPYAKVIHKENEGTYLARYTAFTNAHGRYFVFVDSDDCVHPQLLEKCADAIRQCDPDVVMYNFSYKEDYSEKDNLLDLPKGLYAADNMAQIKRALALKKMNNICLKCCRAELFDGEPIDRELMHLTYYEDWLLSACVIGSAKSVVILDDILYWYRTNDESAMHTHKMGTIDQFSKVCRRLMNAGEEWGGDYPSLFRRGMCDASFDFVRRLCVLNVESKVFIVEGRKLRKLISELDLTNVTSGNALQKYHDLTVRLFMKKKYRAVRLLMNAHSVLKNNEKTFKKIKEMMKRH